ncbi:MAG: hypothetical protein PHI79_07330 [Sulfurovaceae bacterium]|nr:hypothetical protein [Sulfurovaceae bacterium]
MKKIILALLLISLSYGDYVSGYFKKDGTYVNGYNRTSADDHKYNNYSSQSMGGDKKDEFSSSYSYGKSSSDYDYNSKQKESNPFFENADD